MTSNVNIANHYRGNIDTNEAERRKMLIKTTQGSLDDEKFDFKQENVNDFEESLENFYMPLLLFTIKTVALSQLVIS